MGWLNNLWPFSQKISATGVQVSFNRVGQPVWTERDFLKMSKAAYHKCVISYRAIKLISQACATIPLCLFDGDSEIENPNHKLLQLINDPNPWQGSEEFLESVFAYYLLNGNSYIEGVVGDMKPTPMGKGRPPNQLFSLRPDRMKVNPSDYGTPGSYEYRVGGNSPTVFEMNPFTGDGAIIHWRHFNPIGDWYGMAPTEPGLDSIDTDSESVAWNKAGLQNAAVPTGALMYAPANNIDANLTPEQYDRLNTQMKERMQGSRNARKPLLLDGGFKWLQMALSPLDMDWLNGQNASARRIAHAYGVAPLLLGIPGDSTYNNNKEARQGTYEDTVIPLARVFWGKFNKRISKTFGDNLQVRINLDGIDALSPKRAELWTAIGTANWLTTDEKRIASGYEPLNTPEADEVLINTTQTPLTGILDDPAEDPSMDGNGDESNIADDPNNPDTKPGNNKDPKKPDPKDPQKYRNARAERKALNTLLKNSMGPFRRGRKK